MGIRQEVVPGVGSTLAVLSNHVEHFAQTKLLPSDSLARMYFRALHGDVIGE
ncbi:MAG: hypothetical protein ETSY2_14090 [Candidatus Entotheonella gemina]|uniref:Uncharacterized protein n=1 Tax=Candidatus Entotheonella gemina TaxID=1429439 RepID=W4M9U5_9BACT|nr:MAG: hypothetical protein ETSY2_14090 [Candidatus Entotheonella gemina]